MIEMEESGKILKKAIKDAGYTVADIGRELGINTTAIYYWLRGTSLPSIDNLFMLAEILNKRPDELIVFKNMMTTKAKKENAA